MARKPSFRDVQLHQVVIGLVILICSGYAVISLVQAYLKDVSVNEAKGPAIAQPFASVFTSTAPIETGSKFAPCRPRDACNPPARMVFPNSKPPFDCPVAFSGVTGYTVSSDGQGWIWVKDGPTSRPCTKAEEARGPAYKRACAAEIGDILFFTPKGRLIK